MSKIIGLDIGSNSIGWSLIDDNKQIIIDSGSRIFQEGVNKMNDENEISKHATRSQYKSMRVQNKRKKRRMKELCSKLFDE